MHLFSSLHRALTAGLDVLLHWKTPPSSNGVLPTIVCIRFYPLYLLVYVPIQKNLYHDVQIIKEVATGYDQHIP